MSLPSTLVLFATVHGSIPVITTTDAGGQPKKEVGSFKVPTGMEITRVMATRPGVCNMTTTDEINKFVKLLQKNIPSFQGELTDDQIQKLQDLIKKEYNDILESVQAQVKSPRTRSCMWNTHVQVYRSFGYKSSRQGNQCSKSSWREAQGKVDARTMILS